LGEVLLMGRKLFAILSVLILVCTILTFQSTDNPTVSKITGYSMTTSTVAAVHYSGSYVASYQSNIYHKTNCRHAKKIKSHNKIHFKNKSEAKNRL
jgi:hypothetical protein